MEPRLLLRTLSAIAALTLLVLVPAGAGMADSEAKQAPLRPTDESGQYLSLGDVPDQAMQLSDVATITADDVWAVGTYWYGQQNATILHWNGVAWDLIPSHRPAECGSEQVVAVAAVSSQDVWAVGRYSECDVPSTRTLIKHWDGEEWQNVPSPNVGEGHNWLLDVSAIASDDVWAVGGVLPQGHNVTPVTPLILHWDGTQWSVVPPAPSGRETEVLVSVSALSTNDVWAAGFASPGNMRSPRRTLVQHWDGTKWKTIPSPDPHVAQGGYIDDGTDLNAIHAIAPDDVWAVGYYSPDEGRAVLTIHWNGVEWSVVPSPNYEPQGREFPELNMLFGVSATATDDVWAAGYAQVAHESGGRQDRPIVIHWNGTEWSRVDVPATPLYSGAFFGVSARTAKDVWFVGSQSQTGKVQALTGHYAERFRDVGPGTSFYPYVLCLNSRGIVGGYPDGTFGTEVELSRGQAAKIVAMSAGYDDIIPGDRQSFKDIPPGSPFWLYIERLTLHGAISGYPCGGPDEPCPGIYFRSNAELTRGQLSKIVSNVAGYDEQPSEQTFQDVPPDSPFYVYIERVAGHGVVSGYGCGAAEEPCPGVYFRPGSTVTRGQAAKIVAITFFPNCATAQKPVTATK